MRILPNLYMIASGQLGFDLTDPFDCNIFLFDAGEVNICFDAGVGRDTDRIMTVCAQDDIDLAKPWHIFFTHAHSDHGGGAAHFRDRLANVQMYASAATAKILVNGDETAVSLPDARAGGMYPTDYIYRACPIDHIIAEGDPLQIGQYTIELITTPGHSHDHCSYRVTSPDRTYLVSGDALFYGGRIVLQNTYDCDVAGSIRSIRKLAHYPFDALLAGHHNFSLHNGKRHIDAAMERIDKMQCPLSI